MLDDRMRETIRSTKMYDRHAGVWFGELSGSRFFVFIRDFFDSGVNMYGKVR